MGDITVPKADLVNIQSSGGYFVVAEGGGGDVVNANRTAASTWETFRIEKLNGGGTIGSGDAIALQAHNGWTGGGGNYVVAEGGGGSVVNANRGAVGSWETFTIHIWLAHLPSGTVSKGGPLAVGSAQPTA